MRVPPVPNINVELEGLRVARNSQNEGVPPTQSVPVRGRLCQFVEGWKCITNDPYVLSIVAKGYRLCFTIPPLLLQAPLEIRSPKGPQKIQGMQEQISLMLQKKPKLRDTFVYSRVLFKRIPGTQGFWMVASSNRLKVVRNVQLFNWTLFCHIYLFFSSILHSFVSK